MKLEMSPLRHSNILIEWDLYWAIIIKMSDDKVKKWKVKKW